MSLKDDLNSIRNAQQRAKEIFDNTIVLASKFERYSGEVLQRLETIAKNQHFPAYFRRWLRAYYAVLDEIMLVINGELHREYHLLEYDECRHDRTGHSVKYAAGLRLASCSVDGIDYMYNRISKQYGSSKKLEQISLPQDAFCDEVNTLSKQFIANGRDFVDNMAKAGYRILDRNFEVRKEAFHIELTVDKETTICKEDNRSLRKVADRDAALSMIVKDPPAVKAMLRNQLAKASSRKAFDFDDDSDDENIDPFSSPMDVVQNTAMTSFEMEAVSLDQIKQNYGASNELLAIPNERIDVEAELGYGYNNDEMDVDNADQHNIDYNQQELYIQEDIPWSTELPPLVESSMKFKVINPEVNGATSSFVALEIEMSAFDAMADATTAFAAIHLSDIRKELVRYLWMGFTPSTSSQLHDDNSRRWQRGPFVPWLPSTIKIQSIRYFLTAFHENSIEDVALPGREDLKTKRFPVDCDSSPVVLTLMKALHDWVNQIDNRKQQMFRQQILVTNYKIVYHYVHYLKQLHDGVTDLLLSYLPFVSIDDTDFNLILTDEDMVEEVEEEEIILQLESLLLSQYESFSRQIRSISTGPGMLKLRSWWLLLQHFHRIDCSFACLDALQTINILTLPDSTSLRIEELIWRNSPLTGYASLQCSEEYPSWQEHLSKVDCWDKLTTKPFLQSSFPWAIAIDAMVNALAQHTFRDPWADLCRKLFTNAHSLRQLDLSHSWRPSGPLDALVLGVGLIHGLIPVRQSINVQLHGLQALYPDLSNALCEYFVSTKCTIISFDTSGARRAGLPFLKNKNETRKFQLLN